MTTKQHAVLMALNLRQMLEAANATVDETGVYTSEIAETARLSTRSTAVVLSAMREFRWVQSLHGSEMCGWLLTAKGVAALEAERT